ncbi:hypothetical protein CDAR_621541 [Caerostris darwini]|uniref:Uncharacterized protein n=1 Tax=Caerostris darwini TaxID=1538125 RepID=A0AAV4VCC4_9ARAC|nr:hypothetical protein CDAR_621541 [Caerostris darwini]
MANSLDVPIKSGISNAGDLSSSFLDCLSGCTNAEVFETTFTTAVLASPTARYAFDCSDITPANFSKALYDNIRNVLRQYKVPCPDFLSKYAVDPVTKNFQSFTPTFILEIYAKTMAKVLISEDSLNAANAATLGKGYFDSVLEASNLNSNKSGAEYKLRTIFDAYRIFLESIGNFTPDKIPDGCFAFQTEIKLAAPKVIANFNVTIVKKPDP